ncbi:hypothetical protein Hanom_Chr05g00433861 [Helianthus anomalus]
MLEETKKELACAKCENDAIQFKLNNYSNNRYMLDHIIDMQKEKKYLNCVVHKKCPPPDMPQFESSVPLNFDEFAAGLGFKKGNILQSSLIS